MSEIVIPTAVIVNDTIEVTETAGTFLRAGGFRVITETLSRVKKDPHMLFDILRSQDPRIVLFDVPPPDREHWLLLQQFYRWDPDKTRQYLITTVNIEELGQLLDQTGRLAIVGRYNLDELLQFIPSEVQNPFLQRMVS